MTRGTGVIKATDSPGSRCTGRKAELLGGGGGYYYRKPCTGLARACSAAREDQTRYCTVQYVTPYGVQDRIIRA